MAEATPHTWTCPTCGRRVPLRARGLPLRHDARARRGAAAAQPPAAAAPRVARGPSDRRAALNAMTGDVKVLLVVGRARVVAGGWLASCARARRRRRRPSSATWTPGRRRRSPTPARPSSSPGGSGRPAGPQSGRDVSERRRTPSPGAACPPGRRPASRRSRLTSTPVTTWRSERRRITLYAQASPLAATCTPRTARAPERSRARARRGVRAAGRGVEADEGLRHPLRPVAQVEPARGRRSRPASTPSARRAPGRDGPPCRRGTAGPSRGRRPRSGSRRARRCSGRGCAPSGRGSAPRRGAVEVGEPRAPPAGRRRAR